MNKKSSQNFFSLLFAVGCALALSGLLIKSGPSASIALFSIIIIGLCLQVVSLRRDLASLKDQLTHQDKS
jgi:hypothetical protein